MPGSKMRAFLRLGRFEQVWLLPVLLLLGLSRLLILCLSFRRIAPWLGVHAGAMAWTPLLERHQEARALRIGRLLRRVARHTPWQSNCFAQAITARILLGAHGIPYNLFFGLARDHAGLQAHAWVAAGRIEVSGGRGLDRFAVVACFCAPALSRLAAAGWDRSAPAPGITNGT